MFEPFHLLFYKGNSLLGRIVRLFSKDYSHVAFLLDHFHCLEVAWNNPSVIKHFDYKYNSYDIYKLNVRLSEYQKQIILMYIIEHIESGYDWKYLITRGFNKLFGTKVINSKSRLTCDELVYEAFKRVGIHLIDDKEMLTPTSLSKSKYLERVYL